MRSKFWLGFALIFAVSLAVYYPSFEHVLRGETYTYWMDTKGYHSAYELVTEFYKYEKVRVYDPGDRWLFKPLLFTIVGIEKAVFGTNWLGWRIASFIMHVLGVFALYRLLWRIHSGVIAVSFALFFAVLYTAVNTVLYEQIASYTLFIALTLTAMYSLYTKSQLWIGVIAIALSALIYEVGIVLCGVFALYVLIYRQSFAGWKRWALAFGSVIPVYFAFYLAEKLIDPAQGLSGEFSKLATLKTIEVGLSVIPNVIITWVRTMFAPSVYALSPKFYLRSFASRIIDFPTGWFILNAIALMGIAVTTLSVILRKGLARTRLLVLTAMVIAAYMLTICLFRSNTHGRNYILDNSFNAYMFSAFFLVFLYAVIFAKHNATYERRIIASLLLVPTVLSGFQVANLNIAIARENEQYRGYFAYLDDFVEFHKKEADFTFASVSPIEEQLKFRLFTVNWQTNERIFGNYTMTQALYPEYWDNDNPKYVLEYP